MSNLKNLSTLLGKIGTPLLAKKLQVPQSRIRAMKKRGSVPIRLMLGLLRFLRNEHPVLWRNVDPKKLTTQDTDYFIDLGKELEKARDNAKRKKR